GGDHRRRAGHRGPAPPHRPHPGPALVPAAVQPGRAGHVLLTSGGRAVPPAPAPPQATRSPPLGQVSSRGPSTPQKKPGRSRRPTTFGAGSGAAAGSRAGLRISANASTPPLA